MDDGEDIFEVMEDNPFLALQASRRADSWLRGVAGVLGLVVNLCVFSVVCVARRSNIPNLYMLHLSLANVLLLLSIPLHIAKNLMATWIFGDVMCKLYFASSNASLCMSQALMAALCVDVYKVFNTHSSASRRMSFWLGVSSIWLLGTAVFVVFVIYAGTFTSFNENEFCTLLVDYEWHLSCLHSVRMTPIPVAMICWGLMIATGPLFKRSAHVCDYDRTMRKVVVALVVIHSLVALPSAFFYLACEFISVSDGLLRCISYSELAGSAHSIKAALDGILYMCIMKCQFRTGRSEDRISHDLAC